MDERNVLIILNLSGNIDPVEKYISKRRKIYEKKSSVSASFCVAMTATMPLGCSAGSEKSDSKKSSKSESGGTTEMKVDGDATTINVWTFIELHQKFYTEMAKKWNEEHPDKKVKLVLSNMQYDDMHNKLSLALESGKRSSGCS